MEAWLSVWPLGCIVNVGFGGARVHENLKKPCKRQFTGLVVISKSS